MLLSKIFHLIIFFIYFIYRNLYILWCAVIASHVYILYKIYIFILFIDVYTKARFILKNGSGIPIYLILFILLFFNNVSRERDVHMYINNRYRGFSNNPNERQYLSCCVNNIGQIATWFRYFYISLWLHTRHYISKRGKKEKRGDQWRTKALFTKGRGSSISRRYHSP